MPPFLLLDLKQIIHKLLGHMRKELLGSGAHSLTISICDNTTFVEVSLVLVVVSVEGCFTARILQLRLFILVLTVADLKKRNTGFGVEIFL